MGRVTVGEYVAQIVEASIQQPNSGDGYYLAVTWKIIEGKSEGRQVWQRITYLHSSEQAQTIGRKMLKDLCLSTDVAEEVHDAEVFLFKPVRLRLGIEKDKQGIYADKNRVSRIMPLKTKPAEPDPDQAGNPGNQSCRGNGSTKEPRQPRSLARATLTTELAGVSCIPFKQGTPVAYQIMFELRPYQKHALAALEGLLVARWRQSARNDGDRDRQERGDRLADPRAFAAISKIASAGVNHVLS